MPPSTTGNTDRATPYELHAMPGIHLRVENEGDIPLPPGYERLTDAQDRTYYLDHYTQSKSWHHPPIVEIVTNPLPLPPLPEGWRKDWDSRGRVCFVNVQSGERSWVHPAPGSGYGDGRGEADEIAEGIAKYLKLYPPTRWRSRMTVDLDWKGEGMESPGLMNGGKLAGRPYYIDLLTNTVTWQMPLIPGYELCQSLVEGKKSHYYFDHYGRSVTLHPQEPEATNHFPFPPLPSGWKEKWDEFGRVYFEARSGEKQWAHPSPGSGYGDGSAEDEEAICMAGKLGFHPAMYWRSRITLDLDENGQGVLFPYQNQKCVTRLAGRPYYINILTDTVTWHAPTAPGFERGVDPKGRPYYIDHYLRTTQWRAPSFSPVTNPFPLEPLPRGWDVNTDQYGRISFVETATGRTQWAHPRDKDGDRGALNFAKELGFHPPEDWRSRLTYHPDEVGHIFSSRSLRPTSKFNSWDHKPIAGRPYYINISENQVTWNPPFRNEPGLDR